MAPNLQKNSRQSKKSKNSVGSKSDLFQKLIEIGSYENGDCYLLETKPSDIEFEWFDSQLFEKGREFVHRNWFAIFLAHFVSLVVGSALKAGTTIMIRTGLAHRLSTSTKRFLSTVSHIETWYEGDSNIVGNDVQRVRKLHKKAISTYFQCEFPSEEIILTEKQFKIFLAIKDDLKSIPGRSKVHPFWINTYKPEVPLSQLAMVMTQFSFLGFPLLFPKVFGIHEQDEEGFNGFCHVWAVLGKMNGIQDEFNLGLTKDLDCMTKLFNEISIPGLKDSDEVTALFWDGIIHGVQKYYPFMTHNSTLLFILKDLISVPKHRLTMENECNYWDIICYNILHYLCKYALRFTIIKCLTNFISRCIINSAKKKYL